MSSHAIGGRRKSVLRTVFIAAAGLTLAVTAASPAGADVDPATPVVLESFTFVPIGGADDIAPVNDDLDKGTRVGDDLDKGTRVGDDLDKGTRVGDDLDRGTRVGDELDKGTRVGAELNKGTRVG